MNDILSQLEKDHVISPTTLQLIETYCKKWQVSGYQGLLETHIFTEEELADILAQKWNLDRVFSITTKPIPPKISDVFPFYQAKDWECILTLPKKGKGLHFIMSDPTFSDRIAWMKKKFPNEVDVFVGERSMIQKAIDENYPIESQIPSLS